MDLACLDALFSCFQQMPVPITLEAGAEQVKSCLLGRTSSLGQLRQTLIHFSKVYMEDERFSGWGIRTDTADMILDLAIRRCHVSWFFSRDEVRMPIDDRELREAAWNFCKKDCGPWRWQSRGYIPRFGCSLLFWIHFCSGERRSDDVQAYLENLRSPDGYVLRILSVDIIYDPIAGNLACPVNQALWLKYIDRGYVIGFIAGPPCESWSRSRLHGGVAGWSRGDGGPRVLRTEEAPEGLFTMTVAEQQQVLLGNRLLCFIMLAFVHMLRISRFAMVEHPASSAAANETWLASIWKLFFTRVLCSNSAVQRVDIFQGLFGGQSPKPTSLLFCAGPNINVEDLLQSRQTVSVMPQNLQMGWNAKTGEYSTASLKNYPGGLCAAIAHVCQVWLDAFVHPATSDVLGPDSISEFVQFTEKLERKFNFLAQRGADFHRQTAHN